MITCKTKLSCHLSALPVEEVPNMKAQHENKSVDASLCALDCDGPTLCGRDVIEAFSLLKTINFPDFEASSGDLKMNLNELFREGADELKGPPVQLQLRTDKADLVHMVELLETRPLSAKTGGRPDIRR